MEFHELPRVHPDGHPDGRGDANHSKRLVTATLACLTLCGCSEIGYYGHLLRGEVSLLNQRVPIAEVVGDPGTDPKLKARLELVREARVFSVKSLALPDNGSYTLYADVGRRYVVWNVFAAPEFSLQGRQWCFPFVGCLQYRGYYEETRANAKAAELKAQGDDVFVSGISAYSTLGWFDDPVLSTMLQWSDDHLIETLFHELGHQVLYLKGDTTFNESFATFIGEEGLREFRASRGDPPPDPKRQQRSDQFVALLMDTRTRLEALYKKSLPVAEMRAAKQAAFAALRERYTVLKASWGGYTGYDGWFEGELNNARLLPIGLYQQWVPAFASLFEQNGRDWKKFQDAAKQLGKLDDAERSAKLRSLAMSP
jgi:predicted aminopeptidase